MKSNKRLTIGFAGIADFRSIIGQNIVAGINSAARDFNINLINFIGVIRYSLAEDIEYYSHYKKKLLYLNKNNLDGLISWASSFQYFLSKEEIEEFHHKLSPLPVVSIGLPLKDIPLVVIDNHSGVNELMTHLLNVHGYTKFAFIGCKGHFYYDERYEAYKDVLKSNNIPYNPDLVYIINEIDNRQQIKQCLDVFLKKRKLLIKKDIEVFVTASDLIAQKLVEELQELNINVPNDVAVVGFNNQLDSIRSYPPLTTVDPHFFQIGYQSIVLLISMINGKNVPSKKVSMPCQMIIRQSCGCFEDLIAKAEIKEQLVSNANKSFDLLIKEHYTTIVKKLKDIIIKFDKNFNDNHAIELLDSFTSDVINVSTYRFLHAIKKYFFDYKNVSEEKLIVWQNVISEIRNLLLPFYIGNNNILPRVENIFHQTRVMIDVAYSYINFSKKGDVYKTGAMVRIAADFSSVEDLDKIINLIKIHLSEVEIPGIYLALHEEPKGDIGRAYLRLAIDKTGELDIDNHQTVIPAYHLSQVLDVIPKDSRFSMMFELIYYQDLYLGFILFEMGPMNIPIYDTLRTILSPSLYRAVLLHKKAEDKKGQKLLIHGIELKGIKNEKEIEENIIESDEDKKNINAHKILDYLLAHIGEPTDLEKIAKDMNISVPSLIRKTKILTGYSIQKLHEILKMEKAKNLLENKLYNISEIADKLGYQNQFYFSQVFKKHTGMSPKKWVELHQKK